MSSLSSTSRRASIFTVSGIYHLIYSLLKSGVNLSAMLQFAARRYPDNMAITEDSNTISYKALFNQSLIQSDFLQQQYDLKTGKKVAFLCRNHTDFVTGLFAVAACGADIFLLNTEMSAHQLQELSLLHSFDLILHDKALADKLMEIASFKMNISELPKHVPHSEIKYSNYKSQKGGKLVVLTGGTSTNTRRTSERFISVFNFLQPFLALIRKTPITQSSSILVTLPAYHGFGLTAIFVSILLGARIFLTKESDITRFTNLIEQYQIEVVALVPVTLKRILLQQDASFSSVKCIISGGDVLSPSLVQQTQEKFGAVLYNLYGTSEAGFITIATPDDLKLFPASVGKEIKGAIIEIRDTQNNILPFNTVGSIVVKSNWSQHNKKDEWLTTGDIGYRDNNGYLYLKGRKDDMIVSGGENVYPIDVAHILAQHESVKDVAVTAISDDIFGQRLLATIVVKDYHELYEDVIRLWLSSKIARYQQPAVIQFVESIAYNEIGKLKRL